MLFITSKSALVLKFPDAPSSSTVADEVNMLKKLRFWYETLGNALQVLKSPLNHFGTTNVSVRQSLIMPSNCLNASSLVHHFSLHPSVPFPARTTAPYHVTFPRRKEIISW